MFVAMVKCDARPFRQKRQLNRSSTPWRKFSFNPPYKIGLTALLVYIKNTAAKYTGLCQAGSCTKKSNTIAFSFLKADQNQEVIFKNK